MSKSDTIQRRLDIAAFVIAIVALLFSFFTFYYSDLRLTDKLSAVIIAMTTRQDDNKQPNIIIEAALRNEGNRPALIKRIKLVLSETEDFQLRINHIATNYTSYIIQPRTTEILDLTFGEGYTNNPIIISRGYDEPNIYARLSFEVIDSSGKLREINEYIGHLKYETSLNIFWKSPPPWTVKLLPSCAKPPFIPTANSSGTRAEVEIPISNGVQRAVIIDGPLSWRYAGVYTNDQPGSWQVKPFELKSRSWRVD